MRHNQETSNAKRTWIWVALDHLTKKVVAYNIGQRDRKTFKPVYDTLVSNGCELFHTDEYNVYQSLIKEEHTTTKKLTTKVESFWSDVRLFIKGLNRRTKCCFKSLETLTCIFRMYVHHYNNKLI